MTATYDAKKKVLVLEIPIDEKGTPSSTGKSMLNATSGGYTLAVPGTTMKASVCVITPVKKK